MMGSDKMGWDGMLRTALWCYMSLRLAEAILSVLDLYCSVPDHCLYIAMQTEHTWFQRDPR